MKKIYQNFDRMEITFQCAVPRYLLDTLKETQQQVKQSESRNDIFIKLSPNKLYVAVAENGMRGGFTYRINTGDDGVIWAIRDSEDEKGWNVKAAVSSLMLALYGYEETKEKVLQFLIEDLKAISPEDMDAPLERVSRFDFCIDFLA